MTMSGLTGFDEELKHTIPVRFDEIAVPVLKLDRILVSKKAAGRPKDLLAVLAIEDAIRILRSRSSDH
jgi:hypothetical protein